MINKQTTYLVTLDKLTAGGQCRQTIAANRRLSFGELLTVCSKFDDASRHVVICRGEDQLAEIELEPGESLEDFAAAQLQDLATEAPPASSDEAWTVELIRAFCAAVERRTV